MDNLKLIISLKAPFLKDGFAVLHKIQPFSLHEETLHTIRIIYSALTQYFFFLFTK